MSFFVHTSWKTFMNPAIGVIPAAELLDKGRRHFSVWRQSPHCPPERAPHQLWWALSVSPIFLPVIDIIEVKRKNNCTIPIAVHYKVTRNKLSVQYLCEENFNMHLKDWKDLNKRKLCCVLVWELVAWWKYPFSLSKAINLNMIQ